MLGSLGLHFDGPLALVTCQLMQSLGLDSSSVPDLLNGVQGLLSGGAGSNTIGDLLGSFGQSLYCILQCWLFERLSPYLQA